MSERAFWHSSPDALIAGAAQALEAKHAVARYLGKSWEAVDADPAAALLTVVERLPAVGQQRRRQDREMVGWISRLIAEVPADDPRRPEIQAALRDKFAAP